MKGLSIGLDGCEGDSGRRSSRSGNISSFDAMLVVALLLLSLSEKTIQLWGISFGRWRILPLMHLLSSFFEIIFSLARRRKTKSMQKVREEHLPSSTTQWSSAPVADFESVPLLQRWEALTAIFDTERHLILIEAAAFISSSTCLTRMLPQTTLGVLVAFFGHC